MHVVSRSYRPCAYVNLLVEGVKVRFVACVCGCCIADDDEENDMYGGPWLKKLCTDCSVEYLRYMGRYKSEQLQTRLTCNNYLDPAEEEAAELALEKLVASEGQDEEATVDIEPSTTC